MALNKCVGETQMSDFGDRGNVFEQEVETLLALKGFAVSRNELICGTQIDLVARKEGLLDNITFIVECADRDRPVGVELVKQKSSILLSVRDDRFLLRLIFVASNGFTAEAKAFVSKQANIVLATLGDLENELVDFRPYANSYIYDYEHSIGMFREGHLFQNYVELSARDEQDNVISLTDVISLLLTDKSNNLLFLLGEYGSGKTSFCRHLVYSLLLDRYRGPHANTPIPLLINLRDYRSAFNIQQVVTDTLINQYGVQMPSFKAFERICSSGKVLLILDSFDEMAETANKQTLIDCFSQIYLLASLNAKIVLTCRSNFFHSHSDVVELLKHFSIDIPFVEQGNERITQLTFEQHGRILYIERLNPEQIRKFIEKRFGSNPDSVIATLESFHDLSDLSTRPVLLDMILTTLPQLTEKKRPINSAALYEHYTNKWTARDDWRVRIPLEVRRLLCETLAWVMHNSEIQELPYDLLERILILSHLYIAASESQLEQFKNDIQTCSFLVRVGTKDKFRFAHKSFVEFFVARKIISDLYAGTPLAKKTIEEFREKPHVATSRRVGILLTHTHAFIGNFAFDIARDNFKEAVRGSDGFLALRDAEHKIAWRMTESETAMKAHLQEQIRDLFAKHELSATSRTFAISEEIATFAIEYLQNTDTSLQDFISKIKDAASLTLFSDVLRLNTSTEFVRQNGNYMRDYVVRGTNELLKVAFCSALALVRDLVDLEFVKQSRQLLGAESWSYFLFELASRGQEYSGILKECFYWSGLSTLDKLVCVHGMRGSIPEDERAFLSESLVTALLSSSDEKEVSLGLTICQIMELTHPKIFEIAMHVLTDTPEREMKERAVSVLGLLEGKGMWQDVRRLWAREKDPLLKSLLKKAEQRIRANTDRRNNRVSWDAIKADHVVRARLWQSLSK